MIEYMFLQAEGVLIEEENMEKAHETVMEQAEEPADCGADICDPALWTWCAAAGAILCALVIAVFVHRSRKRKKRAKENEMWSPKPVDTVRSTMEPEESSVSVGCVHHIGSRESQQDCFALSPMELLDDRGLLAVVADGMGGLKDGDKVAQTVVSAMLDGFANTTGQPQTVLMTLTGQANLQVNQMLGSGVGRSGSTLVAALVRDGLFHYISIGDSRICLFRDGQLLQLNREHVYHHDLAVCAMNGYGSLQSALTDPKGGGLTSYIGMGQLKYVDVPARPIKIREQDKFILMSDGVYNALTENELAEALCAAPRQAAEQIGDRIAAKALRYQDNYTAVILGF